MAEMITRCPKCGTAFRITGAHMKSAKGSVRCGSCLRVFDARENLTPRATKTKKPKLAEATTSSDNMISNAGDEEIIIDDPDEPGLLRDSDPSSNLFERVHHKQEHADEEGQAAEDESWALELLNNDIESTDTKKSEVLKPAAAEMKSFRLSRPSQKNADWVGVAKSKQSDEAEDDKDPFDYSSFTANRRSYLDAIEPEPVEFAVRADKPFWQRRLFWSSLTVVASLLLAAQIAWLQYPSLNRIEPYRSVYAVACNLIGCTLPTQQDRSAIRTSNLVVRSHPRVDNALMVDVILQNTAPFEQSFPKLELSFSDLQSNLVAQRRFDPTEYLGGELAGQTHMPVKQPVHIAIEIVDPGQQAVNYRIDIVDDAPR